MEQQDFTRKIKNLGYTIDYLIKDDMYSADVYFPWNKKDVIHYAQTGLKDFYKNLYEQVIKNS